jgi:opacity protein-like surface antigen
MRALAFLLLSLVSTTTFADAVLDVRAGTLYDSNLSRAQFDYDIKSDMAVQSSVVWGRFVVLADGLTLRATLDAAGELYTRYSGLNNLAVGGSFALRQKFGLGALAPWVDTSISAARLEYQNSVRDGWRYGFALGGGKRLSAAWNLGAHYCYEHRTADENAAVVPGVSGAVFDLQGHRLELGSEYTVTENLSLAVGYDYRRGDVASTTLRNFTIYTNSDAIALDPVFGDDTVGYRIFAVTRTWRLGLSHALGRSNSINLVAQRAISRARGGLDYYNTLVGASYVHAF